MKLKFHSSYYICKLCAIIFSGKSDTVSSNMYSCQEKALAFNARGETNGHLAENMSLLLQSPVAVCFIPLHLMIWIVLGEVRLECSCPAGSGVTVLETVSWHSLV